jgi:hypothetical protein
MTGATVDLTELATEVTEAAGSNVASGDQKEVANLSVATERKDFNSLKYELSRKV